MSEEEGGYSEEVFEVEKLIRSRKRNGVRFFLVKWVGYPESDCTWESEEDLPMEMIMEYDGQGDKQTDDTDEALEKERNYKKVIGVFQDKKGKVFYRFERNGKITDVRRSGIPAYATESVLDFLESQIENLEVKH